MDQQDTYVDIAADPSAIIARSTCGTAMFFASYACHGLAHGDMQHGFWLSLCLGLVGCLATNGRQATGLVVAGAIVLLMAPMAAVFA